ncbi:hypothetical protein HQ529_03130, partial [Candidatus Woesearchaeota archaeon]|nr:hypothetical protein [Candidatus Woesearchaeota archaeon]
MKNKKGQIVLSLSMMVVLAIVAILIIAGLLIFVSVNKYVIIGGGLIALTLIFGLKGKFTRGKGIFIGILVFVGLVFVLGSGFLQETFAGGTYVQAPTFYYYECSPASAPLESQHIILTSGSSEGWITCPSNTDTCNLYVSQIETPKWFATDRRIIYQKCSASGKCDPQVSTPANSFFSKNGVPTIQISNLLSTDKVYINYQARNLLFQWKDKENGAEWYQTYKPFILWKVDMFGGGRTEYTSIKQGCNFLSSDKPNLLNSMINSIKQINTQTTTSNTNVPFYKTRNFIGTYVPISTANVNFVTYGRKEGYCLNRQVFAITTAVTNGGTYKIVDSNFNTRLANSVTCCPGETEQTRKCNSNFEWENIEVAQCSSFNPCAGADWEQNPASSTQLIRYNCINNKCVGETKKVECTLNSDCGVGEVCDTKLYECVKVEPGCTKDSDCETGYTCENGVCVSGQFKCEGWWEYESTSTEKDWKWYNYLTAGLIKPKEITTPVCK